MMTTTHQSCDACGSQHVVGHCKSKGCNWWVCRRCGSYGDDHRHFDARPKAER